MKKNLTHKLLFSLLFLVTAFFNFIRANVNPPQPPPYGAGGPGAPPSTPIDMYQIILLVLAIILITFFYKKYRLNGI